jgi:hypothetical protein
MIYFNFAANDSFLLQSAHPITIPRSRVNYADLVAQGLGKGPLIVTYPRGERLQGVMYSGVAGFGAYYQIQARSDRGRFPKYLKKGDRLLVVLLRANNQFQVILELRE